MTPDTPNFDTISTLGVEAATLAALIWFGRRFMALHEAMIARIEALLDETRRAREAMDVARYSFERGGAPKQVRETRRVRRPVTAALLCLGLMLPLVGCAGLPRSYAEADRATYDAVAPAYLRYVDGDGSLDEGGRELARLVVETWWLRLSAAGQGGELEEPAGK